MIDNEKTSKLRQKIQGLRESDTPLTHEEMTQKAAAAVAYFIWLVISFPLIWGAQAIAFSRTSIQPFSFLEATVLWTAFLCVLFFVKRTKRL